MIVVQVVICLPDTVSMPIQSAAAWSRGVPAICDLLVDLARRRAAINLADVDTYPRVLHLGFQPVGSPTNAGITLKTMFGDWPEDRLLQVCLRDHPSMPTPENAIIAPASIAPAEGFVRWVMGNRVPTGSTDGLNNSVKRTGRLSAKTRFRIVATAANDAGPVHLPRDVVARVAAFQPQAVHSLLGGVRAMRLALRFSERFDIPIVPHFMDDWPKNLFSQGQLLGYSRLAAQRDLRRVLARAPICLTIGSDMEREFERRYARPCPVVGNSVDVDQYRRLRSAVQPNEGGPCLRYVGGLHLGRDQVVRTVASALEQVRCDGRPWVLELFVPPADAPLADAMERNFAVVRHRGSRTPEEVPEELVRATALLFLESTKPEIAEFTRLSVSTKVPQYLAAGRPLLIIGPEDQGSVRTLRRSPLAEYATNVDDESEILGALCRLGALVGAVPHSAADADWVASEFGTATTRERLRKAIEASVAGSGSAGEQVLRLR